MSVNKNGATKHVLKGALCGLVLSVVTILVAAVIIRMAELSGTAIHGIAQVIKVISIFYAVAVTLRGVEKRGYLFGAIVGIIYTALSFFVFSILDGDFSITTGFLTDTLFAIVIGAISAMLIAMGKPKHA